MDSKTPTIWQASGAYVVGAATTPANLLDDASCFLEAAEALLNTIIDGLQDEDGPLAVNPGQAATSLHGVRYLTGLAHGMASAGRSLSLREQAARPDGQRIGPLLADICSLCREDKETVGRFLRAALNAGLEMDPESFRRAPDATLRAMWGAE